MIDIYKIGTNVDYCERCGAVISDRYSGTIDGNFYWNLCADCYTHTKEYKWELERRTDEIERENFLEHQENLEWEREMEEQTRQLGSEEDGSL